MKFEWKKSCFTVFRQLSTLLEKIFPSFFNFLIFLLYWNELIYLNTIKDGTGYTEFCDGTRVQPKKGKLVFF